MRTDKLGATGGAQGGSMNASDSAKHTPGPWEVRPFLIPEDDDDPMAVYEIFNAAGENLELRYLAAEPETDELDAIHAENAANARLIASAPELLDALEDAHAVLLDVPGHEAKVVLAKVYAAIAKAEGQV